MNSSFTQGDQPWLDNGHYWDDFFLLKVNAKYLLEELERTYIEKPAALKVGAFVSPSNTSGEEDDRRLFVCLASVACHLRTMSDFRQFNASYSTTECLLCRSTIGDVFRLSHCCVLDDLRCHSCCQSCQSTQWIRISSVGISLWRRRSGDEVRSQCLFDRLTFVCSTGVCLDVD